MHNWIPFFPPDASTLSGSVDEFFLFLVGLSLFFIVLIAGLEIYFALKYRRQSEDEVPLPERSAAQLEVVWIIIPFILAMVIFGWGASLYFQIYRMPDEAMDIYVVGKQWMWKLQHMNGRREVNELHVPVGRKVKLTMTSEDVIHDFFVPAFRIKRDVLPGRYTFLWFEATQPGKYRLFCAEYCGTEHSGMIGWVYVMEPAEFQDWLGGGTGETSLAVSGERLFQRLACHTCHRADSQGRGAVLQGIYGEQVLLDNGETVIADEAYLRESILNSQARVVAGYQRPSIMPTFQGQITEDQVLQLIAYIKTLNEESQTEGGGGMARLGSGLAPVAAHDPKVFNPSGSTGAGNRN